MQCQTRSPRMVPAAGVHNEHVGSPLQLVDRLGQQPSLAEGKQTRHIRRVEMARDDHRIDDSLAGDHDSRRPRGLAHTTMRVGPERRRHEHPADRWRAMGGLSPERLGEPLFSQCPLKHFELLAVCGGRFTLGCMRLDW